MYSQSPPMYVDCSNPYCRTPLQIPPGAPALRCVICQTITYIVVPPPTQESPQAEDMQTYPPPSPPPQQQTYSALYPPNIQPGSPSAPPPAGSPGAFDIAPSPPRERRKALLIGIKYKGIQGMQLNGCLNDVICMKYLLVSRFSYLKENILTLTEEESDPARLPTKKNIFAAISWLVDECQPGDSLVFHYSGHGGQRRNRKGEELDGWDETVYPMDFKTSGQIVDDELNVRLVRPLKAGVKLHAIFDSCHSGTILDLPYACQFNKLWQVEWEDHRVKRGRNVSTSGGEAFCFSGCNDRQTAVGNSGGGAMTFHFICAIEYGIANTYGQLLYNLRDNMKKTVIPGAKPQFNLIDQLIQGGSFRRTGLKQIPQLSSDRVFNVNRPFSL